MKILHEETIGGVRYMLAENGSVSASLFADGSRYGVLKSTGERYEGYHSGIYTTAESFRARNWDRLRPLSPLRLRCRANEGAATMKLIYIAGKFTAKTPEEIERNIEAAEQLAREIIEHTESLAVLVPHSLGRRFMSGPGSPAYWYDATLEMSERCDAILLAPGWETSMGTHRERARALSAGKPVFETVEDLLAWHR